MEESQNPPLRESLMGEKLTRKRERAIEALLEEPTLSKAAKWDYEDVASSVRQELARSSGTDLLAISLASRLGESSFRVKFPLLHRV